MFAHIARGNFSIPTPPPIQKGGLCSGGNAAGACCEKRLKRAQEIMVDIHILIFTLQTYAIYTILV